MTAVTVIVPARNAAATIGETLRGLANQDLNGPYEVIVVDDGSEDDTGEIAQRAPGAVSVVRQDHRGAGPARNLGAERATGAALAFTDADCVPTPGWLRHGLAALRQADLVQGSVRPDPAVAPRPFDRTVWVVRESGLYETANLFVDRKLFDRLGGFQDWLGSRIGGRPLGEDVWLGWRARRAGVHTAFCADALVHHAVVRRTAAGYVAERLRLGYFPAMVARMPELRREFLYRRFFLNRKTAAFDLAAAGAIAAATASSLVPLLGAVPYAGMLAQAARRWGRESPRVAAAELVADAIGLAALASGSARWATPVL